MLVRTKVETRADCKSVGLNVYVGSNPTAPIDRSASITGRSGDLPS